MIAGIFLFRDDFLYICEYFDTIRVLFVIISQVYVRPWYLLYLISISVITPS